MIDWKAHIEAEKRAEKAAMAPTEDGQEPIMEYWYNGDGAFAASFNQQNFGEIFSSDGVQDLAKKLVQAWRLHNDPSLDGLPVLVVMRVSGRHPSFIVETDRQRLPFETELEAMTFVRSSLKEAREKAPQH